MERDELIEEISRRKGIAMEEVAEILDEEDAICLEEEEKFVQQMKKRREERRCACLEQSQYSLQVQCVHFLSLTRRRRSACQI